MSNSIFEIDYTQSGASDEGGKKAFVSGESDVHAKDRLMNFLVKVDKVQLASQVSLGEALEPVSYTHLTLPTICSV